MSNTKQTGQQAEDAARRYLKAQGLSLVESNYNCTRGEIDLIMKDNSTIVFIEVRFRRNTSFGSGAESVDYHKQKSCLQPPPIICKKFDSSQRLPADLM